MEMLLEYIDKILFEILYTANELRNLLSVDNYNLTIFTLYFSLIFALSVLSFPVLFICIINIYIFGLYGILISYLIILISISIHYFLVNLFFYKFKFEFLNRKLENLNLKNNILILIFFQIYFPIILSSLVALILKIKYRNFILSILISLLPSLIIAFITNVAIEELVNIEQITSNVIINNYNFIIGAFIIASVYIIQKIIYRIYIK